MIDTQAIKQSTDLLALVERYTHVRKVATTSGRGAEYAGPCPKCGGRDRFHVQPEVHTWMCRQCHPDWGDAIEFVRWAEGVDFLEACARLTGKPTPPPAHTRREACDALGGTVLEKARKTYVGGTVQRNPDKSRSWREATHTDAPPELWQVRGREFASWASGELWKDDDALRYLAGRGLAPETIRAAGLGWNRKTWRDDPGKWGHPPGRKVWLPAGLVIPCELAGQLRYVKIRRVDPDADPRYICVRGSTKRGALYGLDRLGEAWDLVLCEGEMNALTLAQELAGVAGVVSTGDAGNLPGADTLGDLLRFPRWWAMYDADAAGAKGADNLGEMSRRVIPLSWPWGDLDVNDALRAGHNLAGWAIPQLGPTDADRRDRWLIHWLNKVEAEARKGDGPALRSWLALLEELNTLTGAEHHEVEQAEHGTS